MPSRPIATVAGAGNWLLGHDRIGPTVLAMIDGRYGDRVTLCEIGTSPLALLDHLEAQALLVVVDACVGLAEPGQLTVIEPELDTVTERGTTVHQIGPLEALAVARHLQPESMPRRVLLVLVETGGLGEDDERAACERVVAIIDRKVAALGASTDTSVASLTEAERSTPWESTHSSSTCKA